MNDQPREMITYTALLQRKGWTKKLARHMLGAADDVVPSPHCEGRTWRYYRVDRIEAAERTERFRRARSIKAQKALRRPDLVQAAAGIELTVKVIPLSELQTGAIDLFYERNVELGRDPPARIDDAFIRKISMDFALRKLVDYEPIFAALKSKASRDQAFFLIRERLIAKILEVYPDLKTEVLATADV